MTSCASPSCHETFLFGADVPYCLECIDTLLNVKREALKNYEQYKVTKQKHLRFQRAILGYTDAQKKYNCIPTEDELQRMRQANIHFVDEADEMITLKDLKGQKEQLYVSYKDAVRRLKDDYDYVLKLQ